jgi:pilus assembly protein CpaB
MKPSVLITIALLLGAVAAFLVARSVGVGGGSTTAAGPTVVVASVNLEPGAQITTQQLRVMQWPAGSTPAGFVSDSKSLVGRVTKQLIYAGEPILEPKLAPVDAKGGLSSTITPGKRAISVRVNDVIAVAGFTLPGSYVDVMVSARDANNEPFSKIVLNRVKVLAIAQETSQDQTKPKVVNAVTLELSPEESEQLDLARSVGSLSLVLRNELDSSDVSSGGSRLRDLIGSASRGGGAPASGQSSSTQPAAVQEIRGTKRSEAGS